MIALRAFLGLLALCALGGGAWYGYQAAAELPIRSVRFTGETARVGEPHLQQFAAGLRGMPAGTSTLAAVREAARRLPWVREATVRRRFPDSIEVRLEAHGVLARWNDSHLLSPLGEVFAADHEGELPRLFGPEGSGPEMARELPAIVRALEPMGVALSELRLSPRGAWQAVLASGLTLELGRTDLAVRIARFAEAWPRIAAAEGTPTHADLRYPNGFALRRANASRPNKS
jgi:cell division protein FtsQ